MIKKFESINQNQVDNLTKFLAQKLPQKALVLLKGDLGVGKTFFVKSFMKNFDLEKEVSSPTFSLFNIYQNKDKTVYHLDLYRLNSLDEFYDTGIDEYLSHNNLVFVEWPEVAKLEDQADLIIEFQRQDENLRKIILNDVNDLGLITEL